MKTVFSLIFFVVVSAHANEVKTGDGAPLFKTKTHEGSEFDLSSRKGKWTVLYFYPKAGTPGCTKQACAFRDSIAKIRALNAEVYGISADSVKDQAAFHKEHRLNFTLLADEGGKIAGLYGSKVAIIGRSKRWTFIVGPDLKIKNIMKDVDPVLDSERVAKELTGLQKP